MSKIKKLDINNFGSFKNYIWNSSVTPDCEFKDINIIYGRNYSGKTTLSRIFKCIENKSLHTDYKSPEFSFTLEDSSIIQSNVLTLNSLDLCVYNTDFVKENLNWLHNEDGSIEPFTVLGGDNNAIEIKVREITDKLGDNPDEEKEEYSKGLLFKLKDEKEKYNISFLLHKELNEELENKLKKKANQEIKTNSLYQNVNYRINNIRTDIETIKASNIQKLDDESTKNLTKLINEDIKLDIKILPEQKPNFKKYFLEVQEILSRKIKPSNPIQDLLNDNLLQEWVRSGRQYHENKREDCAFCGNHIDEQLWKKLDEHFSKESEELRRAITKTIDLLEVAKNGLGSFINFNEEYFYSTLQSNIKSSLDKWKILKSTYRDNIEKLITQLNSRLKDIFTSIELLPIDDASNNILELIKDINELIKTNNLKTTTLPKDQSEARTKLRLSEISKFLADIDYNKKLENIEQSKNEEERLKASKDVISTIIEQYQEDIRKLQTELNDESKGAELVNEYLEKFFGYNGFKLVAEDETTGIKYKIIRDGVEAKNLSEGECSLVSFCYFIAKIKDKLEDEVNPNSLILYIDDPISSLDNNHIFFIFSLIESIITKPKKYKQLFISTHNLDFLKYIKRLTSLNDETSHFIMEMEQKQNNKRSVLRLMPKHLKDYTTEFNYLFNEIYKLYKEVNGERSRQIENTYNQFYNIPNNIRKFLEYYLFYKYPNTNSPLDNLDKLFNDNVPSLLNRVVNEYSHLTFIDRGWSPIDVAEVEECVKIVIEKIKEKDVEQYEALKQSIGADTNAN
ncbi:MAG: AAA family ATPase [Sulfurimonas sp.]|nr:AAA family ATPase [Sulfurimonas sp.]